MVKETGFYDLLGVQPDASKDQIRKAYYRKAKACHPDKHPGDKEKEAEFKAVSEAYQVLFDDESREKYDRLGKESLHGHGNFADARDVFAAVFGGPEFEPYIGVLKMCAPADEKLQQDAEEAAAMLRARQEELQMVQQVARLSPAEAEGAKRELDKLRQNLLEKQQRVEEASAQVQKQRVQECASFLRRRTDAYIAAGEDGREAFLEGIRQEFESLSRSNMGEPILHAIGYVYVYQTQKVLGKHGVGVHQVSGYFEEAREGIHKFSEVVGAIGSGMRMLRASYKLSKDAEAQEVAQTAGPDVQRQILTDEDREWFQKSVQKRMFHIIWTLTKKDIEDTVREVVDAVLLDEVSVSNSTILIRDAECRTSLPPAVLLHAEAIVLIGSIFMKAQSFDQFIARDEPPSAVQSVTNDLEDRARQAGFDVDHHKRKAADVKEKAAAGLQEAATNAGTQLNKLFGWSKK